MYGCLMICSISMELCCCRDVITLPLRQLVSLDGRLALFLTVKDLVFLLVLSSLCSIFCVKLLFVSNFDSIFRINQCNLGGFDERI